MGLTGLKPRVVPECPQCGYRLQYYCRDSRMPIHMWVMTEESRKHLLVASCEPPAIATVVPLTAVPDPIEVPVAA